MRFEVAFDNETLKSLRLSSFFGYLPEICKLQLSSHKQHSEP